MVDRYRLPSRWVICDQCAVVYANPRLTSDGYDRFYRDGIYRQLVTAATGADQSLESIDQSQRCYAGWIAKHFGRELSLALAPGTEGPAHLVDLGGGVGTLAKLLAEPHRAQALVVDPSPAEIQYARAQGLRGDVATAENWIPDRKYECVTLLQTIDHLPDPAAILTGLRHVCTRLLLVDIVDFPSLWRQYVDQGHGQLTLKIDHPVNFHDAALEALLLRCGFKIVKRMHRRVKHAILYAAEPIDRTYDTARPGPAAVQNLIRGAYCAHTALWPNAGTNDG